MCFSENLSSDYSGIKKKIPADFGQNYAKKKFRPQNIKKSRFLNFRANPGKKCVGFENFAKSFEKMCFSENLSNNYSGISKKIPADYGQNSRKQIFDHKI